MPSELLLLQLLAQGCNLLGVGPGVRKITLVQVDLDLLAQTKLGVEGLDLMLLAIRDCKEVLDLSLEESEALAVVLLLNRINQCTNNLFVD